MVEFNHRFSVQRPYNRQSDGADPRRFRVDECGIPKLESQLESDRGRIINSAAVRRLQQKTQVFALERNAAVRSRLTHSLEVQQTGRFITRTVFSELRKAELYPELWPLERAMESLVEMSCLMHDIGNPPFGHFGEAAISHWFADQLPNLTTFQRTDLSTDDAQLSVSLQRELQNFEGNAQAIRLISSLLKLNLTYVQAAGVFKYTRCATDPKPAADSALSYLQKKPGYYFSERDFVEDMQAAVGMAPGHRHLLAYIMEAADDISYCLADMEDAVDKGLLTHPQLADYLIQAFAEQRPDDADAAHFGTKSFKGILHYALERAQRETINKDHEFFLWLRVELIHPLVRHAAQAFIDNLDAVVDGRLNRALLEDNSPCHSVIATFKQVAVRHVFAVPEVETLELQGFRIITGLLDHFRPLLMLSRVDFERLLDGEQRGLLLESRLFKRLPNKHVKAYLEQRQNAPMDAEVWELYCRCRLLQDMVSGMTDQFALDEFQTLSVAIKS